MSMEEWEKLFHEPPDRLVDVRHDFTEELWARLQTERRQERRKRIAHYARYSTYAAAAVIMGFVIGRMPWWGTTQPTMTTTTASRPTSAERPNAVASVPQSASPSAAASVPASQTAAPKKVYEPPKVVSAPLPDTTGTFPAPRPEILPYRPKAELAVERIGPDGEPVSPTQPPVYRHKGLGHPPIAPPGTPSIHDQITVTPPATTTTEPTTTQPPTGTQR